MVLILEGKNRIRDLVSDDLTDGQLGTDDTAATESDTGLGTAVGATDLAITTDTTDKQIVVDYNLPSTTGNGNTFTEFEVQTGTAGISLNRIVFYDLAKTSSEEFQISTIINIG